ncbi:DUF7691 family protein [Streptomyces millisiae]|uniref:DUF7691 domain-containing protein n=1 Tax=Streptomyces millisiae TaxID=3075542 RepID=A0ABU2LYU1_9ACTN|nr:hypothetical protein [Streptomyces sp. DSM 44918]MDT0322458.1 hypothetical protein [Streptomyces sp. DSM 44918]
MSYGVMAFAADLEWFRGILGCGDRAIVDSDLASWADQLDEIDRSLGLTPEAGCRLAYERMIMGGEQVGHPATYGYCFELFCMRLATYLPNDHWSGMDSRWFGAVRDALREGGVPDFDPASLIRNGPGVPLPRIADFPRIGHVPRERVPALRRELDGLNPDAVADPDALEAIRQMRDWLWACEEGGRSLICFYH